MSSPMRTALEALGKKIGDFSSLEVITFRGDVKVYLKTGASSANDPIDWDKMMADSAKAEGTMSIALSTLVNFDGDVQQFISDPEPPPWVIEAHQAAVKSSLEARKAIFDLFSDVVRDVLGT